MVQPPDAITDWHWDFGDGGTSQAQNPVHTYAEPGDHTVTLIIHTADFCTDTAIGNIYVYFDPVAAFVDTSTCKNTFYFTDRSVPDPNTNIVAWSWDFGDGYYSALQNPVHTYAVSGYYTVMLTVTIDNGCIDSATNIIYVHQLPVADFSYEVQEGLLTAFNDISTADTSATIEYWWWIFGDGGTSTMQNPLHVYEDEGLYEVTMVIFADCGCTDTVMKTIEVADISAISDMDEENCRPMINPNPVNESAQIKFSLAQPGPVKIEIANMAGGVVFDFPEQKYPKGDHHIKWDASDVEPGIYFVKSSLGNCIYISKVVKR